MTSGWSRRVDPVTGSQHDMKRRLAFESRKLSPGSLSFQKPELVLPEGLGGMEGGTPPPTGGHSGPVFAANPRAMQGFRGALGGAFFGLQRVGPETCPR